MTASSHEPSDRPHLEADIVCVGFGPATGGFLTTLARQIFHPDGSICLESSVAPGMPLQVLCYERAEDMGFGVSGIVTQGRAISSSFPGFDPGQVPMAAPIQSEKLVYLMDSSGASRRSFGLKLADALLKAGQVALPMRHQAVELPYIPPFLHKTGGFLLSMGQFIQWVGAQLLSTGAVQIWPGSPVVQAIIEDHQVNGVRLMDQGTDRHGNPESAFTAGMDIRAALTVVGDGPVGAIGRQLDVHFGKPSEPQPEEWAVGMKMVVDLPPDSDLQPGTVLHTFGYPEPEIFGFLYVHPDRVASLGIFVPSWLKNPVRTSYRYLQHWMLHPYLWRHLKGGRLRSWGAKSLLESGRRGEPRLAGPGYARIGEGSGSTNVLTGSGVDEAWMTGVLLAEGVIELLQSKKPFTQENLEQCYVRRRRASWVDQEARQAEKARDGFHRGFITGLIGMAVAGFTKGKFSIPAPANQDIHPRGSLEEYYQGRIPAAELESLRQSCASQGVALHDALMDRVGWPPIPMDGQLLMSHQDALLLGGKVSAPPGYADHVAFVYPHLCDQCGTKLCIEICSGQAIAPGPEGRPVFDREKCVHCGACLWNCTQTLPENPRQTNLVFRAGPGGLHSAEN